jgi:hypothetical protein
MLNFDVLSDPDKTIFILSQLRGYSRVGLYVDPFT